MSYRRGLYNEDGEPLGIEIVMDDDERRWYEGDDDDDDDDDDYAEE